MILMEFKIQQKWTLPGWFEDSFALNFGLPGSAGSVPTVLHDATDTGTDYIVKHLIVVGPRVPKWCPGTSKFNKNEHSRGGMRIHFHWILHSLGIILVGPKGAKMMPRDCKTQQKWTQGHPKGCQNDAQGVPNAITMNPGAPKGGPMRKRAVFGTFSPSHLGTHFDTFSPKDEKKWQSDGFFGRPRANTHSQQIFPQNWRAQNL